ncbi:MAG: TlpA family protein disulfide reductase [Fibrella sp.]|nr:TlpA family protein disulfide reductase [Armatimonadota bacterium]
MRLNRPLWYAGGILMASLMAGCPASKTVTEIPPAVPREAVTPSAPTTPDTSIVPTIDPEGLKSKIAENKGKVVVVNMWATWCGPCVKEFPALISFSKANAERGVELLTVSFDTPKRDDVKVSAFLEKNGQSKGAYLNKAGLDPDGYPQMLEPKLPADADFPLPRTYIFDRDGKLVEVLTSEQTVASLQKAVAAYL